MTLDDLDLALGQAKGLSQRVEIVRKAIQLGTNLHELEQVLDWIDSCEQANSPCMEAHDNQVRSEQ